MLLLRARLWAMLAALLAGMDASAALAQSWPARPVKMVVPYPAGGATDAVGRLFAAKLQEQTGGTFVIENRAGAGGNIGADAVAKAAPDGYTLLFNINGIAIAPAIYKKLAYDPDNDLMRVTLLVTTNNVLVVHPAVPAKSLQELVALAKSKPGVLNYGSTGIGNSLHLGMELFKRQTGTEIQMVPFTGDAPLFQSLFRNDVQMALLPVSITTAHISSGMVRAIGVATPKRLTTLPDVPTLQEQGLTGYESRGWMGIFAPKGTPREVIDRVQKELRSSMGNAEFARRLVGLQLEPVGSTPEEFDAVFRADRERFARVVREANIPQQ